MDEEGGGWGKGGMGVDRGGWYVGGWERMVWGWMSGGWYNHWIMLSYTLEILAAWCVSQEVNILIVAVVREGGGGGAIGEGSQR